MKVTVPYRITFVYKSKQPIYRVFFIGVPNFANLPKMQFATFFQSEKSIFSVGLCAIHTMFQKLKIFKTVEMPYKYVRHHLSWMREIMTFTNKT